MFLKKFLAVSLISIVAMECGAQSATTLPFADFSHWVKRTINESAVIGGSQKTLYEIGPDATLAGNNPYVNMGGSPWATSNVYARVSGVTKGSNAVYPAKRSSTDNCAKLCSQIEKVKVLGLINMNVMVAGSIFLGQMFEPIKSTKNPYRNMDMGMPYTKRPKALVMDYKLEMPETDTRTYATGFGHTKTLQGRDNAVVFIMLQKRWEDSEGNVHASRVATGGHKFVKGTPAWVNGYSIPLVYGDISSRNDLSWLPLRTGDNAYYTRNSSGKLVPIIEEGWDAGATPTHVIVMISAADGEPYVGTEGLTFYVDNIGFK